jgi:adenylate cyclase
MGPPKEIERKYLLKGLPPLPHSACAVEVWQGWIPGQRIHERLRQEKGPHGVVCTRTLKFGRGVSRIEVEEEIDLALFRKMWPLTSGRRVHKRRYRVRDRGRVWELDAFLDRRLFLAEVELPSARTRPALPGWLAPFVVREVTLEGTYVNLNLAC